MIWNQTIYEKAHIDSRYFENISNEVYVDKNFTKKNSKSIQVQSQYFEPE